MKYMCYLLLVVVTAVAGRRITFDDPKSPIRLVETSTVNGQERIDYLEAAIFPYHISNKRSNFRASGELNRQYQASRAPGDERGHLVGSQFSGPAEWFNLSPQSARVNRNKHARYILIDWYGAETKVRDFLDIDDNRHVIWSVRMTYEGNSNRPKSFRLIVKFFVNGVEQRAMEIDTPIDNTAQAADARFWVWRQ